jgi:hypothetical protein
MAVRCGILNIDVVTDLQKYGNSIVGKEAWNVNTKLTFGTAFNIMEFWGIGVQDLNLQTCCCCCCCCCCRRRRRRLCRLVLLPCFFNADDNIDDIWYDMVWYDIRYDMIRCLKFWQRFRITFWSVKCLRSFLRYKRPLSSRTCVLHDATRRETRVWG